MIVMARKNGRLGNRLALACHFAAFSRERNVTVWNLTLDEYAGLFEGWDRDLWGRYPPRPSFLPAGKNLRRAVYLAAKAGAIFLLRFWPCGPFHEVIDIGIDRRFDLSDPAFVARARRKVIFTIGWLFRDDEAVRRHGENLRGLFRPTAEHRRSVADAVMPARDACDVLVGVHIRHGDYATFQGGRFYYTAAQYRGFMDRMAALLPGRRLGFLICSDAPQPREVFAGLKVFDGPGHLVQDMIALAECDYIIGPPSTFSYWASYSGKRPLLHLRDAGQRLALDDFRIADQIDE